MKALSNSALCILYIAKTVLMVGVSLAFMI